MKYVIHRNEWIIVSSGSLGHRSHKHHVDTEKSLCDIIPTRWTTGRDTGSNEFDDCSVGISSIACESKTMT